MSLAIHCISLPTPFRIGPVNVYLVCSQAELALIDSGPYSDETYQVLKNKIHDLGYDWRELQSVIITHAHLDHAGLAGKLVEDTGAKLYAHIKTVPRINNYLAQYREDNAFLASFLPFMGLPLAQTQMILSNNQRFEVLGYPGTVTYALEDGERIFIGNRKLEVIFTPGHTNDCICLYEPEEQILFTGDHLLKRITSNPLLQKPLFGENPAGGLGAYVNSLQKIQDLPIANALPGHDEPLEKVAERIERLLIHHNRRKQRVYDAVEEQPLTPYEISSKIFRGYASLDTLLCLSEIAGHLTLLEEEELIDCERREDLWLVRKK